MPDLTDLYERYMSAAKAAAAHRATCSTCASGEPCPTGTHLQERLARLQDAYLTQLRTQRR